MPSCVRPARPRLWLAELREMGCTTSDSILASGLYTLLLLTPGSTTYTTPSMVILASAMLVEKMHLRPRLPFTSIGRGPNICACFFRFNVLYSGKMSIKPYFCSIPLSIKLANLAQALSISSSPVRKHKISPYLSLPFEYV